MSNAPAAAPEVRRIASMGLSDDGDVARVAPERWPTVLWGLTFHRLTGVAVAACEAGQLELGPEQVDELLDNHHSAMLLALRIEQRLLRLTEAFTTAGIRAVVLKGPAVAHTLYPDPAMRPFGDLDLLVSTTDWRAACEILRKNGYTRDLPEPRRGFDERFGKAATHSGASGLQVDLHRTLVLGPFGLWLDPEELLHFTATFVLGGRTVARLDTTGLLLNSALHAVLGASPPLLLPLRDVVQAARSPDVDWVRLVAWASRWQLSAALGHAFASASREFGVDLPAAARGLTSVTPRGSERRAMRAYTERRRAGGVALAATRAIPGLRAKAAYIFGLLLPSREFLRARAQGGAGASYLSRWRVPVRWIARRDRRTREWSGWTK